MKYPTNLPLAPTLRQTIEEQESYIKELKAKLRKLGLYAAQARMPQVVVTAPRHLKVDSAYVKARDGMRPYFRIDVTERTGE